MRRVERTRQGALWPLQAARTPRPWKSQNNNRAPGKTCPARLRSAGQVFFATLVEKRTPIEARTRSGPRRAHQREPEKNWTDSDPRGLFSSPRRIPSRRNEHTQQKQSFEHLKTVVTKGKRAVLACGSLLSISQSPGPCIQGQAEL